MLATDAFPSSRSQVVTIAAASAAMATVVAASNSVGTAWVAVPSKPSHDVRRNFAHPYAVLPATVTASAEHSRFSSGIAGVSAVSVATTLAAVVRSRRTTRRGSRTGGRGASRPNRTALAARGGNASGKVLHVGLVGYGLVGKEFERQLLAAEAAIEKEIGASVKVEGIARSSVMTLTADEEPVDLDKFAKHLLAAAAASGGRAVIVDNTASDAPAELYEGWLDSGINVVTPNKRAGSGPYARYERITAASRKSSARFLYEATVGAGLPIIGPLQGLTRAGDEVRKVQGIFSGTLSYIFNTWKAGQPFSEVVNDAKAKGFTEPDPRDDLGGTDVQRKVVILAREMGLKLELEDVPVESLVPESLRGDWQPPAGENLGDAFVKELSTFDHQMGSLIEEAESAGEVLRFVGVVDVAKGSGSVRLGRFAKDHPFAGTQFADNIVVADTKFYTPRPLVVQGPGAGASVTAAGVFGNVMEIMRGM